MHTPILPVILIAGSGSRLRPHTDNIPKCLVPLHKGVTVLDSQLHALKKSGLTEVMMVIGYRGDLALRRYLTHIDKYYFK